jgi:ABC-type Fe3+ transport system substrate-binding protein
LRRYAALILFVIVLAAPLLLRSVVKTTASRADATSSSSGAARLVIITPNNQDIRREFARAFSQWHAAHYGRPVVLDYRVPGGTHDIRRQLADTYESWRRKDGTIDPQFVPDIQIVWGGGDFFFDRELPRGVLQPMKIDKSLLAQVYPSPNLAGVRLYEATVDKDGVPTPKWVGICLSAFGICYNPDVYQSLGISPPSTWRDLTDPRITGQLALADPTHSGSAATAYMMVVEREMVDAETKVLAEHPNFALIRRAQLASEPAYLDALGAGYKRGMSTLTRIAANARYFTDSSPQVPSDVGTGEAAAGIAIDFYGRVYEDVVGPQRCRFVTPVGATAITPDPVGILAGVRGEQLELAQHFVEFLLTPEGQRLWILRPGSPGGPVERALRRPPARADVYAPRADRSNWTDDVNPFTQANGFNQRADFMAMLFTDTRDVWTAAWIDSREALLGAYDKILRVPDINRRDALLDQFADLPITMNDVITARDTRKRLESDGGAELWKARYRIELAKRFRAHFDRVGQLAK